jgi:hypothetical protein
MSCTRCAAIENLFDNYAPCWHCGYPGIDTRTEDMIEKEYEILAGIEDGWDEG